MSTITVAMPAEMIAERQRLGLDIRDEVWEGVYHVVPPASEEHQHIGAELLVVLAPLARSAGLRFSYETGVFDPQGPPLRDYCVPDLVFFLEEYRIPAGVNGRAELVIEIRSAGDDGLLKVPYYSRVGVQELVVIERDSKEVRQWTRDVDTLNEVHVGPGPGHALTALPVQLRGAGGRVELNAGGQVVTI
jgi:hypothetical protein